jgi:hypothetical protein
MPIHKIKRDGEFKNNGNFGTSAAKAARIPRGLRRG